MQFSEVEQHDKDKHDVMIRIAIIKIYSVNTHIYSYKNIPMADAPKRSEASKNSFPLK